MGPLRVGDVRCKRRSRLQINHVASRTSARGPRRPFGATCRTRFRTPFHSSGRQNCTISARGSQHFRREPMLRFAILDSLRAASLIQHEVIVHVQRGIRNPRVVVLDFSNTTRGPMRIRCGDDEDGFARRMAEVAARTAIPRGARGDRSDDSSGLKFGASGIVQIVWR